MKLYMVRAVRLSIIRSLFTVYVIQVCRQLLSRSILGQIVGYPVLLGLAG